MEWPIIRLVKLKPVGKVPVLDPGLEIAGCQRAASGQSKTNLNCQSKKMAGEIL
jgi:hypothetical protein